MTKLCLFDLETTGVDPYVDRVVECAFLVYQVEGNGEVVPGAKGRPDKLHTLVNPGVPIPPEATLVHGIDDARVKDAPSFGELAADVEAMVDGAVLVGYNSRNFDTPMLHAELQRCGRQGLPTNPLGFLDTREIDLLRVWRSQEPRTLETAVQRFAGMELGDAAHTAMGDTVVLLKVLAGMSTRLLGLDPWTPQCLDELQSASVPEGEVDRAGKFRVDDGKIVFTFGKHQGEAASDHPDYLTWMLGQSFPPDTMAVVRSILSMDPWAGGVSV
jgi:DNA polymerase III subunit epsilon